MNLVSNQQLCNMQTTSRFWPTTLLIFIMGTLLVKSCEETILWNCVMTNITMQVEKF